MNIGGALRTIPTSQTVVEFHLQVFIFILIAPTRPITDRGLAMVRFWNLNSLAEWTQLVLVLTVLIFKALIDHWSKFIVSANVQSELSLYFLNLFFYISKVGVQFVKLLFGLFWLGDQTLRFIVIGCFRVPFGLRRFILMRIIGCCLLDQTK